MPPIRPIVKAPAHPSAARRGRVAEARDRGNQPRSNDERDELIDLLLDEVFGSTDPR